MAIEFKKVSFAYSKKKEDIDQTIYNINIKVNSTNEFVGILGHTGSGKSTFMQHINGLIIPSEGTVEVFDKLITNKKRKNPKMKDVRKRVGYVFQFPEYQLFEETVLKDIMFGPINFGLSKEQAEENARKYAKLLNIEHILDKSPFELSGGQMRKVAIAGVLAYEPSILLLDEPTRGLDPQGAVDIMKFFTMLNKEYNKTIIMITHDMDLAYEHVNRMVIFKEGKIEYDGSKENLFTNETYLNYHLRKPLIIDAVDEINKELNLNIGYDNYNIDDLLSKLRGEING